MLGSRGRSLWFFPGEEDELPLLPSEREAKFSWLRWSFAFYQGCSEKTKEDQSRDCYFPLPTHMSSSSLRLARGSIQPLTHPSSHPYSFIFPNVLPPTYSPVYPSIHPFHLLIQPHILPSIHPTIHPLTLPITLLYSFSTFPLHPFPCVFINLHPSICILSSSVHRCIYPLPIHPSSTNPATTQTSIHPPILSCSCLGSNDANIHLLSLLRPTQYISERERRLCFKIVLQDCPSRRLFFKRGILS